MSQPTPYTPTTDFSQQEANNASGRSTVNTAALDAEFANIETTLDQLVNNIQLIQRDDGNLADESVTIPCLDRNVVNLIGGFVVRGDWVTGTAYSVNDIVAVSGYLYLCATAHTASASFVTDAAKWKQFGFKPSDGIAAAAAQASIDAHIADSAGAHTSTAISHGVGTVSSAISGLDSTKSPLASPVFTGNPTAPTAASGNVSLQLANTSFVANAISALNIVETGIIYTSVITSSGPWSLPPDLPSDAVLVIELWGAGGGGASRATTGNKGGGGGGAYTRLVMAANKFSPTGETIDIGSGGLGGTVGTNANGSTGGDTKITLQIDGVYLADLVAKGGSGGVNAAVGVAAAGGYGGVASANFFSLAGGSGGAVSAANVVSNGATVFAGGGGKSHSSSSSYSVSGGCLSLATMEGGANGAHSCGGSDGNAGGDGLARITIYA